MASCSLKPSLDAQCEIEPPSPVTVIHGERATITSDEIYAELEKVLDELMPRLSFDDGSFGSLHMLHSATKIGRRSR